MKRLGMNNQILRTSRTFGLVSILIIVASLNLYSSIGLLRAHSEPAWLPLLTSFTKTASTTMTITQSGTITRVISFTTVTQAGEPTSAEGTLDQEVISPICATAVPRCGAPSFVLPILVTGVVPPAIYLLSSDDPGIRQQLYYYLGSRITIQGLLQSFDASKAFNVASYTCSPYPCETIKSQIVVNSIAVVSLATMATAATQLTSLTNVINITGSAPSSAGGGPPGGSPSSSFGGIPGFEAPSILIGLILGLTMIGLRSKRRRSVQK